MRTRIIEATNGERNWGKFLLGQFTSDEWARRSLVNVESTQPLLRQIGWGPDTAHYLVLDLQTGEGALFRLGGLAHADLHKHKVWVCPLFEPFLDWLYAQWREHAINDAEHFWRVLPDHVDLPDAPFALYGYRREGPTALDVAVRHATDHEQRAALIAEARRRVQAGTATHECDEWVVAGRCELCDCEVGRRSHGED